MTAEQTIAISTATGGPIATGHEGPPATMLYSTQELIAMVLLADDAATDVALDDDEFVAEAIHPRGRWMRRALAVHQLYRAVEMLGYSSR